MSSALDEIQEAGSGSLTDRKGKAGGKGKLLIIGLVVVALAGGAGAFYYMKTHPQSPKAKRSGKDLEVLNYSLQKAKDGGLVYVVGTLTNHAPSQYFTLRVEFDLFDKSGNKVDNTSDYFSNLGPTSAWSFKALVLEQNATEAKLVKVLGEADTAVPDSSKKEEKVK